MDARLHKASARVAHVSLKGQTALPLTEGRLMAIALPLADLLEAPFGPRARQLVLGEPFRVIDEDRAHSFGFAEKDGYCGWLPASALGPAFVPTHWVRSPGTHLYDGPRVQNRALLELPMGARLRVIGQAGGWAETGAGFVPAAHLAIWGEWAQDPVTVAESLLHSPYLWGGNSRGGLDCSGLVQMAHLACGIECPADSDLQQALGQDLPEGAALRRGDLLFWPGHVGLMVDGAALIHANAHAMAVSTESLAACAARTGPPMLRRRL